VVSVSGWGSGCGGGQTLDKRHDLALHVGESVNNVEHGLLVLRHHAAQEVDVVDDAVVLLAAGLQVLQTDVQQLLLPLNGVQLGNGQRSGDLRGAVGDLPALAARRPLPLPYRCSSW